MCSPIIDEGVVSLSQSFKGVGSLRKRAVHIEGKPVEYWLRILASESPEVYRRYQANSPFIAISVYQCRRQHIPHIPDTRHT
jgi:hypothetical protein